MSEDIQFQIHCINTSIKTFEHHLNRYKPGSEQHDNFLKLIEQYKKKKYFLLKQNSDVLISTELASQDTLIPKLKRSSRSSNKL